MNRMAAQGMMLLSAAIWANAANAGVISVPPFQGELTETWESFPPLSSEDGYLPNPSLIMEGSAIITHPSMAVFQIGGPVSYSLGTSGPAQPSDGMKGMGIGIAAPFAEIIFVKPISVFGAYWGAYTHPVHAQDPAPVSVSFFDASDILIGIESFLYSRAPIADGLLEWHGWSSTTPIKRISYSGRQVVTDGLQANLVPEPATAMLLALAAMTLRARRRGSSSVLTRRIHAMRIIG